MTRRASGAPFGCSRRCSGTAATCRRSVVHQDLVSVLPPSSIWVGCRPGSLIFAIRGRSPAFNWQLLPAVCSITECSDRAAILFR
jgi:hypothetical protein